MALSRPPSPAATGGKDGGDLRRVRFVSQILRIFALFYVSRSSLFFACDSTKDVTVPGKGRHALGTADAGNLPDTINVA